MDLAPVFGCLTKIEHQERAQELEKVKQELEFQKQELDKIKKILIIRRVSDMYYLWSRGYNLGESFKQTQARCNVILKQIGLPFMLFNNTGQEKSQWCSELSKCSSIQLIQFHKFLHAENSLYHAGCGREPQESEKTFADWMTFDGFSLL